METQGIQVRRFAEMQIDKQAVNCSAFAKKRNNRGKSSVDERSPFPDPQP
jgi:hypothetical protein